MSEQKNRRLISGSRVLCKCSLGLPKLDPFSSYRAQRRGFMVLNVRGGSLYLAKQFTAQSVKQVFPPDKSSLIKDFTLHADDGSKVVLGDMNVRFLKLTSGRKAVGLVLRFVNMTEKQLDMLNGLATIFPAVEGDEEEAIPLEKLYKMV